MQTRSLKRPPCRPLVAGDISRFVRTVNGLGYQRRVQTPIAIFGCFLCGPHLCCIEQCVGCVRVRQTAKIVRRKGGLKPKRLAQLASAIKMVVHCVVVARTGRLNITLLLMQPVGIDKWTTATLASLKCGIGTAHVSVVCSNSDQFESCLFSRHTQNGKERCQDGDRAEADGGAVGVRSTQVRRTNNTTMRRFSVCCSCSSWLMLDAEQTCVVVSVYNASPKMFSMITEKATVVILDPVLRVTSDGADVSYKTIQVCFADVATDAFPTFRFYARFMTRTRFLSTAAAS